jgi:hypothetical protein
MSTNALGLSDEDFLKQPVEAFADEEQTAPPAEAEPDIASSELDEGDGPESVIEEDVYSDAYEVEEDFSEAQEEPEAELEDTEVTDLEEDTFLEDEPASDSDEPESLDTSDTDQPETDGDTQENNEFDYKSAYEKVMAPFKANGVMMQVDNPDDAVRLMQMGANYQKKMQALKPNLKIIKMLDKNGLLDTNTIGNLIDLANRSPAAIAKLVKDSGIDPLDIDTSGDSTYQPGNYEISDKEFELDQVLENLKENSNNYSKTIDVVGNQWDSESRKIVTDNPVILEVIDDHLTTGVFDQVMTVMSREKALGKLNGMPDVVAYKQIVDSMTQQGLLVNPAAPPATQKPVSSDAKASKSAKQRQAKRKAAAPAKATGTQTKQNSDAAYLGLSDEEFMKQFG